MLLIWPFGYYTYISVGTLATYEIILIKIFAAVILLFNPFLLFPVTF